MRGLQVTPVVKELRERFESIRAREVEARLRQMNPADRSAVEALTRSIVNKLLHRPTTQIRMIDADSPDGLIRLDAVRELFGLDATGADADGAGGAARDGEGHGLDGTGEKS